MRFLHQAVISYVVAGLLLTGGCATSPRRLRLPQGPGSPLRAYVGMFEEATTECRRITTMEVVLAIRGQSGDSRIRGRVRAALARPASMRLEGVAHFGPPGFVLVAAPGQAVLVLPRERQVVTDEDPGQLLAALTGLTLDADDLRAVLTGCVMFNARPIRGRVYSDGWMVVEVEQGGSVYLRTVDDELTVVAGARPGLLIEYFDHVRGLPRRVEVRTTATTPMTELTVTMSQVSFNIDLNPAVFIPEVSEDHVPITLEQLHRGTGPLAEPSGQNQD